MKSSDARLFHLFFLAIISTTIAHLQILALTHFWYWEFWWMDWIMHSLGGLLIGSTALFFARYRIIPFFTTRPYVALLIFSLMIVSVWEIFEVVVGATTTVNYPLDTATDVALGTLLAFLVYFLLWRKKHST